MKLPSGWIARPKLDRKGIKVEIEMSELILCKDCESIIFKHISELKGEYK